MKRYKKGPHTWELPDAVFCQKRQEFYFYNIIGHNIPKIGDYFLEYTATSNVSMYGKNPICLIWGEGQGKLSEGEPFLIVELKNVAKRKMYYTRKG